MNVSQTYMTISGMHTTGIYRLSGNAQAIQALINEIDKDPCKVDYKSAVSFKFLKHTNHVFPITVILILYI